MKLFSRQYGTESDKPPLIIIHGLFGSSDNWLPQAKLFGDQYKVYAIDQRNHGQSPHDDAFDYESFVADLLEFINDHQLKDPIILGHSMGGKTAMNFGLSYPEKVSKLIIVDIAPRAYDLEHYTIADGLTAIPIDQIKTRGEADEALSAYVPEVDVRQFLLKNIQRTATSGFSWKINLPVITRKLSNVGVDLFKSGTFDKPSLFIRGDRSSYIRDEDRKRIKDIFPKSSLVTMATGHWVQAEKPREFVDVVMQWLATKRN